MIQILSKINEAGLPLSSRGWLNHYLQVILPALVILLQLPASGPAAAVAGASVASEGTAETRPEKAQGNPQPQTSPAVQEMLTGEITTARTESRYYQPEAYPVLIAGRDLILNRKYDQARTLFESFDDSHPNDVLGPVGMTIALTAQYLETRSDDTLASLREASRSAMLRLDRPPPEQPYVAGWRFLRAVALGNAAMLEFWDDSKFAAYRRAQSALSELEKAKKAAPEFADPEFGLGLYEFVTSDKLRKILFFLPDNRQKGVAMLERAAAEGHFTGPIARISLMWMYRKMKRFDDIERTGENLERRYPGNVLSLMLRGHGRETLGDWQGALKLYARMIEVAPDFPKGRFYCGKIYFDQKDFGRAREHLAGYVEAAPVDRKKTAEGYYMLGKIHEMHGDPSAAEQHYRLALSADPKNQNASKALNR